MSSDSMRQLGALVLIGILVAGAGCSGLGLGSGVSAEEQISESTPTEREQTTTETATSTASSHDSRDHSHGSADTTEVPTEPGNSSGMATGKLTVVVGATEVDVQSRETAGDEFDIESDPHTWSSGSNQTLAAALSTADIDASATQLTFDSETYRESTSGTTLVYRANGEPVDPERYTLEDGDQIWVAAETGEMNRSTPGTYIDNEQQHIHGDMTVTVDGEQVDFSNSKYQSSDRYFHFEGGTGEYWHAHSWSLSLGYGLSSLPGFSVDGDTITHNGTTYDPATPGTTVTVTVNGEPVDIDEYYLKDGDDVEITLNRT